MTTRSRSSNTNAKVNPELKLQFRVVQVNSVTQDSLEVKMELEGSEIVREVSLNQMTRALRAIKITKLAHISGRELVFAKALLKEVQYVDFHYEDDGWVCLHKETDERPNVEVLVKCKMDEYFNNEEQKELP